MRFFLTLTSEQLYGPETDDLPEWPVVIKEVDKGTKLEKDDPHVIYSEERLDKVREDLGAKLAKNELRKQEAAERKQKALEKEIKDDFRLLNEYEDKMAAGSVNGLPFHPGLQVAYLAPAIRILKRLKYLLDEKS